MVYLLVDIGVNIYLHLLFNHKFLRGRIGPHLSLNPPQSRTQCLANSESKYMLIELHFQLRTVCTGCYETSKNSETCEGKM